MLYYINIQNGGWGWDINQVSEQVLKPDIVPVGTMVAILFVATTAITLMTSTITTFTSTVFAAKTRISHHSSNDSNGDSSGSRTDKIGDSSDDSGTSTNTDSSITNNIPSTNNGNENLKNLFACYIVNHMSLYVNISIFTIFMT